mmetsp:Transcript_19718/g.40027  ORF Transcript_19718/g.40027 Transcript_19718/m.40027 type:complete len:125 (-) Transcript_19718:35-409(-)
MDHKICRRTEQMRIFVWGLAMQLRVERFKNADCPPARLVFTVFRYLSVGECAAGVSEAMAAAMQGRSSGRGLFKYLNFSLSLGGRGQGGGTSFLDERFVLSFQFFSVLDFSLTRFIFFFFLCMS